MNFHRWRARSSLCISSVRQELEEVSVQTDGVFFHVLALNFILAIFEKDCESREPIESLGAEVWHLTSSDERLGKIGANLFIVLAQCACLGETHDVLILNDVIRWIDGSRWIYTSLLTKSNWDCVFVWVLIWQFHAVELNLCIRNRVHGLGRLSYVNTSRWVMHIIQGFEGLCWFCTRYDLRVNDTLAVRQIN